MLHYYEPNAKVFYDEEIPCVRVEWKGDISQEVLCRVLAKALPLYKEKKQACPGLHWISDVRGVTMLPRKHADAQWHGMALDAGLDQMSVIKPFDAFVTLNVNRFMQAGNGIKSRFFDSVEDARRWFKTASVA